MFTPQKKNKQGLQKKQLLLQLSPDKYVEHEKALKFLETVPKGMGVHTIVQALNEFEDNQKNGTSSNDDVIRGLAEAEDSIKKAKAALANNKKLNS